MFRMTVSMNDSVSVFRFIQKIIFIHNLTFFPIKAALIEMAENHVFTVFHKQKTARMRCRPLPVKKRGQRPLSDHNSSPLEAMTFWYHAKESFFERSREPEPSLFLST